MTIPRSDPLRPKPRRGIPQRAVTAEKLREADTDADKITGIPVDSGFADGNVAVYRGGRFMPEAQSGSGGGGGGGVGGAGITELFTRITVQSLTASSTITVTDGSPYRLISSSGNITLTSTPHIAAGRDGQIVLLKNVGSFNIILQDINALGASLVRLTANTLTIQSGGTMALVYDGTQGFWIEQYLLNPQAFAGAITSFTVDGSGALTHEWGDGATANDTAPAFVASYVGVPSAASVTLTVSPDPGYPLTLTTPFTSGTGAAYFRSATRNGTRTFRLSATVSGSPLTSDVIVTYRAPNYYGVSTQTTNLTSAQVVALTHALDTDALATYSGIPATGASDYIWFGFIDTDVTLDTNLFFAINGERALFLLRDNPVSVTSQFLKVQNYETYRSQIIQLGTVTVVTQSTAPPTRRFVGKSAGSGQRTEAQIEALQITDLVASPNGTFASITGLGTGDYLWFCVPGAIAAPTNFGISPGNGSTGYQQASFTAATVQSVTNQYGFLDAAVKNIRSNVTEFQAIRINNALATTWSLQTQAAAFNNRTYMGPATTTDPITNANILALDDTANGVSVLQATVAGTYVVTITGSNYLWFCHPDAIPDLLTIKDNSTGFAIAGSYRTNVSHTNDFGFTETYRCWRSDNVAIFPSGGTVVVT